MKSDEILQLARPISYIIRCVVDEGEIGKEVKLVVKISIHVPSSLSISIPAVHCLPIISTSFPPK